MVMETAGYVGSPLPHPAEVLRRDMEQPPDPDSVLGLAVQLAQILDASLAIAYEIMPANLPPSEKPMPGVPGARSVLSDARIRALQLNEHLQEMRRAVGRL